MRVPSFGFDEGSSLVFCVMAGQFIRDEGAMLMRFGPMSLPEGFGMIPLEVVQRIWDWDTY